MESRGALFREIHKNTWLKKFNVDGRKKSEKCWVVFCVHDDCEALLEGYAEPRMAPSHSPEWTLGLGNVQHISHALAPQEHEFEFVITLSTEVARFNAPSWECMLEWVETLRSKLREMKILSPKENLYSKLPEFRPPLLPTRDPTSPLPAPPPVPAAIVPGVERINVPSTNNNVPIRNQVSPATQPLPTPASPVLVPTTIPTTAMSNTSIQNIMNLLSNPLLAYSSNSTGATATTCENVSDVPEDDEDVPVINDEPVEPSSSGNNKNNIPSLAATFTNNVLSEPYIPQSLKLSHSRDKPNAVSLDVKSDINDTDTSSNESTPVVVYQSEPLVIPRPHTSRNGVSANGTTTTTTAANNAENVKSANKNQQKLLKINNDDATTNITIIQVSNTNSPSTSTSSVCHSNVNNKTTNDVFNFNSNHNNNENDDNFKSNVQIIATKLNDVVSVAEQIVEKSAIKSSTVTTVQVPNNLVVIENSSSQPIAVESNASSTPITKNKNKKSNELFGPITNISIGPSCNEEQYYDKVFLSSTSSSIPSSATVASTHAAASSTSIGHINATDISTSGTNAIQILNNNNNDDTSSHPLPQKISFLAKQLRSASHSELRKKNLNISNGNHHHRIHNNRNNSNKENSIEEQNHVTDIIVQSTSQTVSSPASTSRQTHSIETQAPSADIMKRNFTIAEKNIYSQQHIRPGLLQRGVTEISISRPSKNDNNQLNRGRSRNNNNIEMDTETPSLPNRPSQNEANQNEQRKRSSSTSDAQNNRPRNNQIQPNDPRRLQSPPQPFRHAENNSKNPRLTLREQQVFQLRREMMHPGGVRLQLRRKDCINSIGLVEAFGGVWIAGWKQKEHPVLYNALHIGDQLVSVAGTPITSANEVNKIIRAAPGLFVELIVRRVPFGRVYAIRREIDGQCLGLIRDGNTATIVDIVPNSLAARHGLPPKAQSCDGINLSFWVLTEINGRPLNLFFKENEIRDRLAAVGRDISILVQPSDLVAKFKKQLKSLRGYKDFIVQ